MRAVRDIDRVCVCVGGGEKHFSRVEYRAVSQRVTIFSSHIISNCLTQNDKIFVFHVYVAEPKFSLHLTKSAFFFFWGGGVGGLG